MFVSGWFIQREYSANGQSTGAFCHSVTGIEKKETILEKTESVFIYYRRNTVFVSVFMIDKRTELEL